MLLQNIWNNGVWFLALGFHALWHSVPGNLQWPLVLYHVRPHISPYLHKGIRFVLCRFHSLLLTASHLLSLPAGTKMLQFPAFLFPCVNDSGILGSKDACASPRLIAA